MAGFNELLRRAHANPASLRFSEACQLAEGAGFTQEVECSTGIVRS